MQLLISSCIRNFRLPPASALLVSVNAVQIFGPATQPPFSVGLLTVRISQVWFRVFVFVFVFILAPPPTTPYAHVGHVPVPRRRAQPAITGHVVGCGLLCVCYSQLVLRGLLPAGIDARSRPSRGRTTHAPSRDPPSHARGTRGFPRGTQRAALRPLQTQAEVLCGFGRRR